MANVSATLFLMPIACKLLTIYSTSTFIFHDKLQINSLIFFFFSKSKWCKLLTLSNAFSNTVVLPNSVELIAFTKVAIKSLQNV